jgi:hypothetical protein
MWNDPFTIIFIKLIPKLDKYFHVCLTNAGFKGDKRATKRYLIYLTGLQAYLNSQKKKLENYDIEALIWLKARNVWAEFKIPPKKDRYCELEEETYAMPGREPGILDQIIARQEIARLRPHIDDKTWEILLLLADGNTYKEIGSLLNENESKVKMQVFRMRRELKRLMQMGMI